MSHSIARCLFLACALSYDIHYRSIGEHQERDKRNMDCDTFGTSDHYHGFLGACLAVPTVGCLASASVQNLSCLSGAGKHDGAEQWAETFWSLPVTVVLLLFT